MLWWMNRCTQSTDPYLISLLDLIFISLRDRIWLQLNACCCHACYWAYLELLCHCNGLLVWGPAHPCSAKSWEMCILLGKCPSSWPWCSLQGWCALMCFAELESSVFITCWWLLLPQQACFWDLFYSTALGCGHFASSYISRKNYI